MMIGFAGVGMMGQGMAARLLAHDVRLTILAHRSRAAVEALLAQGACEAPSAEALAAECEVICLCLPNSSVVERFIETVLPRLRPGQMIIDMTTARPESSVRLHELLRGRGVGFVDAPVAGGPKEAEAGELGALVGAAEEDYQRALPLLRCFCREISWFGPAGSGNKAKLMSNYLMLGMVAVIGEAFRHARQAGIDWQNLYDVMLCGSGNSVALRRILEPAIAGDFNGYRFSVANAAKDSGYAIEMLNSMQCTTPLAEAINAVYVEAAASGNPKRFISQLLAENSRNPQH